MVRRRMWDTLQTAFDRSRGTLGTVGGGGGLVAFTFYYRLLFYAFFIVRPMSYGMYDHIKFMP